MHYKKNIHIYIVQIFALLFFVTIYSPLYTKAKTEEKKKTKSSISADLLEGGRDENDEPYKSLVGNVYVSFEDITIYADSATYFDDKKLLIAYGNIRIVHKDGSVVHADQITYDDKKNIAELEGNITIESEKAIFSTNKISYNTKTQKGDFKTRGTLQEGENILTSERGFFDKKNESAYFEGDVTLENADYTLHTSTMEYSNISKIAKFKNRTVINSKDGTKSFIAEKGGEYNTKKEKALFKSGTLETDKISISAETIKADEIEKLYSIDGSVEITVKEDDIKITGDYAIYDKNTKTAELFGNVLLSKNLDGDNLYISSGRLTAEEVTTTVDEEEKTTVQIKAFDGIKMFKTEWQAIANSMVYDEASSTINIEENFVFWNYQNQITADGAVIKLNNGQMENITMTPNGFLIFKDNLDNFNQIKGDSIVINFMNNKITNMQILTNVEVIYYAIDKKKTKGINILKCGSISIDLQEERINKIDFPLKSQGKFYPEQLMHQVNTILENFSWREDDRPTLEDVLYGGFGSNKDFQEFKFNKK